MANYTTYSFQDISMVISHPSVGQFSANGDGLGSLSISMSTDRTVHDVSADGSVMASKVNGRNGTIAITTQQTTNVNKWLSKCFNYLDAASSTEWSNITISITSKAMGDTITCYRTAFQKLADRPYQAQGQEVTWNLMSQDIHQTFS